jgi:hypothetical protein
MMRLFWVDGRLSWPFVVAVVFVTTSALAADFVWRLVVIPFTNLVIYAAAADLVVAALLILVWMAARRKNRSRA